MFMFYQATGVYLGHHTTVGTVWLICTTIQPQPTVKIVVFVLDEEEISLGDSQRVDRVIDSINVKSNTVGQSAAISQGGVIILV